MMVNSQTDKFWLQSCLWNPVPKMMCSETIESFPKPEIRITSEPPNSPSTSSKWVQRDKLDGSLNYESIQEAIDSGIAYLNRICDPVTGFQNSAIGETRSELKPKAHYLEVFTSTLAIDLLGHLLSPKNVEAIYKFVMPEYKYGAINFNKNSELVPDDVDTTCLAMAVFLRDGKIFPGKQCTDVVRLTVLNTTTDGVIETYYPPRGIRVNRVDPATTSNVMRFVYATGFESEAKKSEDYLYNSLQSGEFMNKCYYYVCPEAFFFFLSTAIVLNDAARKRFESLLLENIKKRFGSTKYPLDCAMRVLAIAELGLVNDPELKAGVEGEVEALMDLRKGDGSGAFKDDCLFRLGRSDIFFGGDAVSTIFGVAALHAFIKAKSTKPDV